jgi:hypothetical protein
MYEHMATRVAVADAWLRMTGVSKHLLNFNTQHIQQRFMPLARFDDDAAATGLLTANVEEHLLALAHLVAALLRHLPGWATA